MPPVDRHKVNPTWHASGRFLVIQSEMENHPLSWLREDWFSELVVNGLWSDLYAVSPDGQRWYRLTNYSNTQTDGAMAPHFSADGTKLFWSRMIGNASDAAPFGVYRLQLADFVIDSTGVPSLRNVRDITPAGANFVEAHGFSPDGRKVIFTGDMQNTHTWGMDIYTMDLSGGSPSNLTKSPHWEEHARYSPSGRQIAYMSSEPYLWLMFHTELMLVDVDTGQRRQATHFNVSDYPEFTEGGSMATRSSWNADGTRLALTQQLSSRYPGRQLWVLTFAGPCGG
jgi:Tol biopolymer transport system component